MDQRIAAPGTDFAPGDDRYRTPGVYYEEQFASVEAPAFRTGVPAFVGFTAPRVTTARYFFFTRWRQFEARFGHTRADGFLGDAVRGFFENGGTHCAVVPVYSNSGPMEQVEAMLKPFEPGGVLEDLEDVDLICVPDAMKLSVLELDSAIYQVQRIQTAALEHCRRMRDRFAILDGFPDHVVGEPKDGDVPGLRRVTGQWQALPAREGALYFPWVRTRASALADRVSSENGVTANHRFRGAQAGRTADRSKLVPPCGHVAGVYSRVDADIGVHKAPANAVLEGVVDLATHLDDAEQADLNDRGVNCLRSFPGRGIRVWGARTLNGQANWRYVNVSRFFLTLARWLQHGLDDLVFEPNGPSLWDGVRDRLISYCQNQFERGALKGNTADEAFFVKCDAEINSPEIREAGEVIAEVGLAPLAPAEFIIVHITRRVSGAAFTLPTTL